jgi:hypothetical protein
MRRLFLSEDESSKNWIIRQLELVKNFDSLIREETLRATELICRLPAQKVNEAGHEFLQAPDNLLPKQRRP